MPITFDTLLSLLWQKKAAIAQTILLFVMLALFFLWHATPLYSVTMVIGPTSATGAAAMGARAPEETYISPSMAEHAANENLSDYARYQQLLTSYDAAMRLANDTPSLMQSLFQNEWDAKNNRWAFPLSPRSLLAELQARAVGGAGWHAPDAERLQSYLKTNLLVTPVAGSPMRRLTLRHADKGIAVNMLWGLHKAADSILREEASRRSDAIITYINTQLQSVTIAEHRAALTRLLAEQERTRLLISVDLPYAADLIEPPRAGSNPVWPNAMLFLSFAVLAGFVTASLLIVYRYSADQKTVAMRQNSKIRLLR